MKTLSELKDYEGTDVNREISLYEYGLLCKKDFSGNIHCYYGVSSDESGNYNLFDSTTTSEEELNTIFNESWFNKKGFLSFLGMTEDEFNKEWYVHKISDMIQYYGCESIFGTIYAPFEIINK